jgi:elongation factor G
LKKKFHEYTKEASSEKAVIANEIFPVLQVSALKNKGVQLVLDAVVDYLPAPLIFLQSKVSIQKQMNQVVRHASDTEPFSALAFKVATDPFVGQIIFFRVYSGT